MGWGVVRKREGEGKERGRRGKGEGKERGRGGEGEGKGRRKGGYVGSEPNY